MSPLILWKKYQPYDLLSEHFKVEKCAINLILANFGAFEMTPQVRHEYLLMIFENFIFLRMYPIILWQEYQSLDLLSRHLLMSNML